MPPSVFVYSSQGPHDLLTVYRPNLKHYIMSCDCHVILFTGEGEECGTEYIRSNLCVQPVQSVGRSERDHNRG